MLPVLANELPMLPVLLTSWSPVLVSFATCAIYYCYCYYDSGLNLICALSLAHCSLADVAVFVCSAVLMCVVFLALLMNRERARDAE
jgi:hypothetical protein